MIKRFISVVAVLVLGGCATIFTGSTSNVNLQAVDSADNKILENVSCTLTDGDGTVYTIAANPGSVIVSKGKGTLRADCKKKGYVQQNMGVAETINGVTFVNVLFWPGFIVDAVTGTMHKYPANVTIQMKKQA